MSRPGSSRLARPGVQSVDLQQSWPKRRQANRRGSLQPMLYPTPNKATPVELLRGLVRVHSRQFVLEWLSWNLTMGREHDAAGCRRGLAQIMHALTRRRSKLGPSAET